MYRIYGAKTIAVARIRVVVRVEHVITVSIRVRIAKTKVSIVRVSIDIARSHPNTTLEKTVRKPTTMPKFITVFTIPYYFL